MRGIVCILALYCLLHPGLALAEPPFTPQEIQTMHRSGIRVAFAGERESYVIPQDISPARLTQAEVLDFNQQPLYDIPSWFAKFSQLRNLNLASTKIDIDDLLRLGHLPSLEVLDLRGNNELFEQSDEQSLEKYRLFFSRIPNIRHLNLRATGLREASHVSLAPLKNLRVLDLGYNGIREIKKLELAQLQELRELSLNNNSDIGRELVNNHPSFRNFPSASLQKLSLQNCRIESHELHGPMDMPELRYLDLSDNWISELPFLGELPSLEIWDLSENPRYKDSSSDRLVMDERYGGLFVLQNLKQLKVDDNAQIPGHLRKRLHDLNKGQ